MRREIPAAVNGFITVIFWWKRRDTYWTPSTAHSSPHPKDSVQLPA